MNKSGIILLICFFFAFFYGINTDVWAEEEVFRHPLTSQTRNTFNVTCANLSERPIVRGNFVQEKYLNRLNRSLVSSGNFLIAAEQGMVWDTLQPFPSTMIMGKDFIMQSRPNGQKSVISSQGNETFTQMADVINSVFSGQSQRLLENFDVYFTGSVSNWNMGLLPRDSVFSSFISRITMSGGSAIRSIKIFEQNGDVITYTLSNHNYPAALNNNERAFFTIP
ncbi:MAG: outer membrane lipoprotein carrier protein LolA [Treponema sp.]|nr:outer membrane lipoprotein carrier protein LolA [Treponema sp.]